MHALVNATVTGTARGAGHELLARGHGEAYQADRFVGQAGTTDGTRDAPACTQKPARALETAPETAHQQPAQPDSTFAPAVTLQCERSSPPQAGSRAPRTGVPKRALEMCARLAADC